MEKVIQNNGQYILLKYKIFVTYKKMSIILYPKMRHHLYITIYIYIYMGQPYIYTDDIIIYVKIIFIVNKLRLKNIHIRY